MNNKVNYTAIGISVIFSIFLILGFSYWLLKPSHEKTMRTYNIYFDESVLGLNIDAPIRYNGISVGKVTKLQINPSNMQQVEVQISIFKNTPINTSTTAKLTSQGITGLSFINLSVSDVLAKEIKLQNGEKYPVIKTIQSMYSKLEDSFGSVTDKLSNTLLKTNELLNKENQKQVAKILENSALLMGKINTLLDDETIKNFQQTALNMNTLSDKMNKLMPKTEKFLQNSVEWEDKVSNSFNSITTSYMAISESMTAFKSSIKNGDFNLKDMTSDLIPTMNNTFLELQQLSIKLENAIEKYERSPADVLYKREEITKGPGEK
jgi:phospholipid/cholesterol/gamma-HCH transport system substrate-binding protein